MTLNAPNIELNLKNIKSLNFSLYKVKAYNFI